MGKNGQKWRSIRLIRPKNGQKVAKFSQKMSIQKNSGSAFAASKVLSSISPVCAVIQPHHACTEHRTVQCLWQLHGITKGKRRDSVIGTDGGCFTPKEIFCHCNSNPRKAQCGGGVRTAECQNAAVHPQSQNALLIR